MREVDEAYFGEENQRCSCLCYKYIKNCFLKSVLIKKFVMYSTVSNFVKKIGTLGVN